jgi:hypothetical protein
MNTHSAVLQHHDANHAEAQEERKVQESNQNYRKNLLLLLLEVSRIQFPWIILVRGRKIDTLLLSTILFLL